MNFSKQFWLFFWDEEEELQTCARKTTKYQTQQQQKAKEAENHHQNRVDVDDLLDDFEGEDMSEEFYDDEFIN